MGEDVVGSSGRLVVVAGSGRSGTSSAAGVLHMLGLGIPGELIEGDRTNPRGFYEPAWVVDFQQRLLDRARVRLTDARPSAFTATHRLADNLKVRAELTEMLRERVDGLTELVVKDPRNSWFLPLWRHASLDLGFTPVFLTMLRHPAEVIESKATYYGKASQDASTRARGPQSTRAAGWLNVMLYGELETRGSLRTFIRYDELLLDWRAEMRRAARELELTSIAEFSEQGSAEVDDFLDPDLHRVRADLDQIDLPDQLRALCSTVWDLVNELRDSDRDPVAIQKDLDRAREEYVDLYADAEAIADSSILAARMIKGAPAPNPMRERFGRLMREPHKVLARKLARLSRAA